MIKIRREKFMVHKKKISILQNLIPRVDYGGETMEKMRERR